MPVNVLYLNVWIFAILWTSEAMRFTHHPIHFPNSINHIDDVGSKDLDTDIDGWRAHKSSDDNQQYHWLDDDLVQKNRREPDGLIRLDGGCEMTPSQYRNLQQFRRDVDYVQNCYCLDGSVYCKLKKGGDSIHITK